MNSRIGCVALFGLGVLAGIGAAQTSAPASRGGPPPKKPRVDLCVVAHDEAIKALVTDLGELAGWAEKQKLDREKAHVLDLVLVFDPENAAAREGLGYAKGKAGGWERVKTWHEPGNRDAEALQDFKKKKAEVGGTFLDAMAKLVDENRRDMDPALKARIVSDMNAIDANDPRSKTVAGEALVLGKWMLADTAQTLPRRKQLQAIAKAAITAAGTPQPSEAMGNEASWDVKWATIVETENLRVLGTGSKEETTRIAILCQAAGEFFSKTFEVDVPHQSAYKLPIYVLADPGAKANFLRNNKSIKPQEIERLGKLGGFWVDGAACQSANDTPARIDGAVRMIMGTFLGRSFGIDGGDRGALYEGLGIHLSWFLTGTRLTWTIGQRKYAQQGPDGMQDKLRNANTDWFPLGYDHVIKAHPPLKPLLAKHLNDLETEDLLTSYMLAVWLVEGRKDDSPRFLRFAGRGQPDQGAKEAFGLEFNQMEERLARWAKEMRNK